ncbi:MULTISPECIES: hypothetical protein [unclassified Stenotrophomonas]|uniref:hypothetical protein n=1 Tax=unclassified Stenotrophomonas TaxID=196198 RepID=UPI0012FF054D|nr:MULTISPECIES: hypothetical protein [unclassified Stenotrophomonas]
MTTPISESPVTYTSFISVQLASKPSVPRALSTLRTLSNPARDELPSSLNRTPVAAHPGPAHYSAVAASSPNAAAGASDWKDYVGHLQQQDKVPGAGRSDPDQGVVIPSNISVKQMLAFLRNQPPATPAGVAQGGRPPTPAPAAAAAVHVAAVAESATVPSVSVLQTDDPVWVDDPWELTTLLDQMEHPHRAAEAEAASIDAQLLEEERALDEELGALAEAQRPRGAKPPMILEEDEENPFQASELVGTIPRWEQGRLRSEAMLRANAALEEENAEPVLRSPGRRGNVKFDQVETSRVLEVDAESGELVSVIDAFFLTKEHDGKWKPNQSKQSISPHQISDNPGTGPRVAAFAMPRVLTAADDSGCVVHSVFHEDRYDQPTHAEMGEAFWSDLGRDDAPAEPLASGSFWGDLVRYNEPAEPGVGEAFLQLQQLQKLQELHGKLEAALRHNQQLKEEVGVYL